LSKGNFANDGKRAALTEDCPRLNQLETMVMDERPVESYLDESLGDRVLMMLMVYLAYDASLDRLG
jgi:hypothetical protein